MLYQQHRVSADSYPSMSYTYTAKDIQPYQMLDEQEFDTRCANQRYGNKNNGPEVFRTISDDNEPYEQRLNTENVSIMGLILAYIGNSGT